MSGEEWWLTGFLVVLGGCLVCRWSWDVWRRPDKVCWWCCGRGRVFSESVVLRRVVSGRCLWCRGRPVRLRLAARVLGWTRNSGPR